jgi:phosphatidylglycerol:prolipoprotein diacylglycerol transferase
MAALALSLRTARIAGVDPDRLWNAGIFAMMSAFVVSRLLLVLTNLNSFLTYPLLVLALPSLTPAGMLLTVIATLLYLRLARVPVLSALDAWSPCATLAWAFLALGHYVEGSDPGMITAVPWAVASPSGLTRLHPVALYVAMCALLLTGILLYQLPRRRSAGDTVSLGLASAGVIQFLLTFLRQPALYGTPFSGVLDPIQWAALIMIATAGLIILTRPAMTLRHAEAQEKPTHAL